MSKKKKETQELSACLSEFIKVLNSAVRDRGENFDEVHRMDGLQQDLLHQIELDELDYGGRAKIATQLMRCRQRRRECKDAVELLDPLVELMNSKLGVDFCRQLNEVLGKTRKIEARLESRVYCPRVLIRQVTEDDKSA